MFWRGLCRSVLYTPSTAEVESSAVDRAPWACPPGYMSLPVYLLVGTPYCRHRKRAISYCLARLSLCARERERGGGGRTKEPGTSIWPWLRRTHTFSLCVEYRALAAGAR